MRHIGLRILLVACALLGLCFQAAAQEATFVGSVTDPTGAVIPGATITFTNQETGQIWTVTSNEAGQYLAGGVRIGAYSIRVEAKGFKAWTTSGVALRVGDRARVDARLEIGSATDSITVEDNLVRVQSESAEISDVVNASQISTILTNGRHFAALAALVPGASSNLPSFNFPQAGNVNISFNGSNPAHNVWLTDGAENYDRGGWGTNTLPSTDAVAEFRTMTSNYSAEYGLASGATISMAFRTGTKDLHGAAWEVMRNDNLDANDWFRNKSGTPKAPLAYNVYGFNIGGPVAIGGYNKNRDKTFFFYNMEWRKIRTSGTATANVAPTAWRTGDLFSLMDPAQVTDPSKRVQVRVPAARMLSQAQIARFAAAGLNPGDAFPNNTIPSSLIDPNATAALNAGIMPAESYMENGIGKWTGGSPNPNNVREEIVRMDHRFTDKFSVFGHYIAESMARVNAPAVWSGGTYPTVGSAFSNPSFSFLVHSTYAVTPTLLNETAFQYSGNKIDITPTGIYQRPGDFDVPELFEGNAENRIPRIGWAKELGTNYNTWQQPWANNSNTKSIRDDVSLMRGRHELKFGVQYLTYAKKQQIGGTTQGNFNFDGSFTGSSFVDFLLGYAANYNELMLQDAGQWKNDNYTAYFQDNWRVTNRLTLNLGVRWEGMPAVVEINNRMSSFYPHLYDPANAPRWIGDTNQMDPAGPGFQTVPGIPLSSTPFYMNGIGIAGGAVPRGLVNNTWNNWAPRVGLAYDVTGKGKTVIRAGFGRMYERVQGNDVYTGGGNTPFSFAPTVTNVMLSNPNMAVATGVAAETPFFPANIVGKVLDGYKAPTSNQWSFSVQRELFARSVLSVAYVGNNSFHQSLTRDINSPLLSQTADRQAVIDKTVDINRVRPYPGWGTLVVAENAGTGYYNALQANLRVNAARGLDLQVAYTYSQTINDINNQGSGGDLGAIDNPYDRSYNRGPAPWDRPQILSVNYTYALPFFKNSSKAMRALLGGWRIAGITSFAVGAPVTPAFDNSQLGMSGVANRPNFTGSVQYTDTIANGTPQWFTDAGFSPATDLTFGTAEKGVIRGPGRNNWDIALHKEFAGIPFINPEGANLQLRIESFNTFNHTQWAGINANYSAGGFGNVNSTLGPRQVQLTMKLAF